MKDDPIEIAILNLRQAIAGDDRCKNVTSVKIFMNTYETKLTKTSMTSAKLKQRGISMKNIAGDFIINDYGYSSLPYEAEPPEEDGAAW